MDAAVLGMTAGSFRHSGSGQLGSCTFQLPATHDISQDQALTVTKEPAAS